jgi:H+/gluconate symporter-like permease
MAVWRQVTPNEAMQHPLYGVGGWLLFFMILVLIGIVYNIYQLTLAVDDTQVISTIISLVISLLIVLLCFSKSRSFPTVTIVLLWINVAITVIGAIIFASAAGPAIDALIAETGADPALRDAYVSAATSSLIVTVVIFAVLALLMTWYLVSSKRVNVTYRHRVRD